MVAVDRQGAWPARSSAFIRVDQRFAWLPGCWGARPVVTNRFDPFTFFFIRGSVLPSVGLPHSQPPSVRHGVSASPVSYGQISRA